MAMGDRWDYPEPFAGVRLDRCEVPGMPGGCLKAFAGPLGEGRAAVRNDRTGDSLAFRWDSAAIPFLGLWINRGHCGFHHVALEPASGAPDALSGAPGSWDPCPILPPRASVSWSITCLIT